ncbi:MAG: TorF family putative porin [Erythrobacter sp.]
MRIKSGWLVAAVLCAGFPGAAMAQGDEEAVHTVEDSGGGSGVDISANIAVVSDYRFRGISLSDRDPALQGGIDVSFDNGLFLGTWASTIADFGGSNVEVDIYGGYAGSAAGLDYTVTALAYVYPGGTGTDYYEFSGAVDKTIGSATVGVLVAYVPDQDNFPGDNLYLQGSAGYAIPDSPISLNLRAGREASAFSKKWDWEAGIALDQGPFTASLSYVDSDAGGPLESGRLGQSGVVASLAATF